MKRYIACLLLLGMLLITTTGCSTSTNNDAPAKEDIHENLKVVFDEICHTGRRRRCQAAAAELRHAKTHDKAV